MRQRDVEAWRLRTSPVGVGEVATTSCITRHRGREVRHCGALQGYADGATEFAVQAAYRQAARQAYVRYDVGERMRRAILRKAAPVAGKYKVGDIVSFCRNPRKG